MTGLSKSREASWSAAAIPPGGSDAAFEWYSPNQYEWTVESHSHFESGVTATALQDASEFLFDHHGFDRCA
jgi:hypothetical protein